MAVGAAEVGAAFFHFDQDQRLPDVVGEGGAAAVFLGFANAELGGAADFEDAALAEGLEEAVEEDLGLAFFVASDVGGGPIDEFLKAGFAVLGLGSFCHAKSKTPLGFGNILLVTHACAARRWAVELNACGVARCEAFCDWRSRDYARLAGGGQRECGKVER